MAVCPRCGKDSLEWVERSTYRCENCGQLDRTYIDLYENGEKRRVKGWAWIDIVHHLRWEIDKEMGKAGCRIVVSIPSRDLKFNFLPSHGFCEDFANKMLECEWTNDNFEFSNPVIAKKRPPELPKKIKRLEKVINFWKGRELVNNWKRRIHEFM